MSPRFLSVYAHMSGQLIRPRKRLVTVWFRTQVRPRTSVRSELNPQLRQDASIRWKQTLTCLDRFDDSANALSQSLSKREDALKGNMGADLSQ
jgi:hypothetical protein